jgi:hypothetical protein
MGRIKRTVKRFKLNLGYSDYSNLNDLQFKLIDDKSHAQELFEAEKRSKDEGSNRVEKKLNII